MTKLYINIVNEKIKITYKLQFYYYYYYKLIIRQSINLSFTQNYV